MFCEVVSQLRQMPMSASRCLAIYVNFIHKLIERYHINQVIFIDELVKFFQ
jgi:hypothetical protein